jgi:hypothetical protein
MHESLSLVEREKRRIPHQKISQGILEVKAEARKGDQSQITVRFALYEEPDYTLALYYKQGEILVPLSLVTQPTLQTARFPRISESVGIVKSVFLPNAGTYKSPDDVKASPPKAESFFVDEVVARSWNLQKNQYSPLKNQSRDELAAANAIVTSYAPLTKDGDWYWYESELDLTPAYNPTDQTITLMLKTDQPRETDILISSISLDYRDLEETDSTASPL